MALCRAVGGTVVQTNEPSWKALVTLLGGQLAGWFMWTHELRLGDGTRVDAFKHVATRRYVHLAPDLRAFRYRPDGKYTQIELVPAIAEAFLGGTGPSHPRLTSTNLRPPSQPRKLSPYESAGTVRFGPSGCLKTTPVV